MDIKLCDLCPDPRAKSRWLLLEEWGEPFAGILGGDALVVSLSTEPRRAVVRATGSSAAAALARLR